MESSPLIQAHDHAREASIATHTANTAAAVTEHALAAGEFATAAETTSSAEALRTLRLLEQHHERLSRLLRYSLDHPTQQQQQTSASHAEPVGEKAETASAASTGTDTDSGTTVTATAATAATTSVSGVVTRGEFAGTSPTRTEMLGMRESAEAGRGSSAAAASMSAAAAAHRAGAAAMASALATPSQRRHPPSRELSSSIASNLASARGIRSRHRGQPAAPSMSSDQAPGNLEGHGRPDGLQAHMQSVLQQQKASGKPSWVPPKQPQMQQMQQPPPTEMIIGTDAADDDTAKAEEGFSRFYSRFGSIINRLSAPLAFAGLPLIAEEEGAGQTATKGPTHAGPPRRRPRSSSLSSSSAEPELSKIYAPAALRAMGRDGHSATDSFYVVPKTGHTASYANILSFDQKEKRRMAASQLRDGGREGDEDEDALDKGDEDDFADAKEAQSPTLLSRLAGGPSQSQRSAQHRLEELHTENESLKDMLDKLSKRLHAFEANAQHSHMALQESMRFMRPGSPGGEVLPSTLLRMASGSGGGGGDELARRNRELEEDLAQVLQKLEASEKERARQDRTLQKYREKWEKLKAGAKARREGAPTPK